MSACNDNRTHLVTGFYTSPNLTFLQTMLWKFLEIKMNRMRGIKMH
jgi:hypothetical protein